MTPFRRSTSLSIRAPGSRPPGAGPNRLKPEQISPGENRRRTDGADYRAGHLFGCVNGKSALSGQGMAKSSDDELPSVDNPKEVARWACDELRTLEEEPSIAHETQDWPKLTPVELAQLQHVAGQLDGLWTGALNHGSRLLYEATTSLIANLSERLVDDPQDPKVLARIKSLTDILYISAASGLTSDSQQLSVNRFVPRSR